MGCQQKTNHKSLVIFVSGGPGSGKGTQCQKLVEKFGFKHLSTGDLLREERKNGSQYAEMIEKCFQEGKLVPSELLVCLIQKQIQDPNSIYLLDGFPRNEENLKIWNKLMADKCEVEFMLLFDCSDEVMLQRLLGRSQTSQRSDDNEETIQKRIQTYKAETEPILNQLQSEGKVEKISAEGEIEQIFQEVSKRLAQKGIKPKL